MHLKAVLYKGVYLAPNSDAFELFHDKKFKELDALLKKCDQDEKALLGRYKRKEV